MALNNAIRPDMGLSRYGNGREGQPRNSHVPSSKESVNQTGEAKAKEDRVWEKPGVENQLMHLI